MVLLAITVFIVIVLASVMKQYNGQRKPQEACNTLPCLTEAIRIMRYTDPNANPCDDFYQFTCGNFDKNSNEDENMSYFFMHNKQLLDLCNELVSPNDHAIIKLIKKTFLTCTTNEGFNTNSKQTLKKALAAAGGWPVLEGAKWNETKFDWKNASYTFRELGYYDEFFVAVNVDHDADNKTNFLLEVLVADVYDYHYGILGMDKAEIMTEVAVILGAENTLQTANELTEAHNLQQALQEMVYYKQDEEHAHFKYTIHQFQELCSSINWLEFINNMLGPKIQVTSDQIALFPPPETFTKWFDLILNAPKRVQANYMMWKLVERALPLLTRELQYFKLGLQKKQSRQELCLDVIRDMGLFYPLQIVLHRRHMSTYKRECLQDFLNSIKNQLIHSLNKSTVFKIDNREKALNTIKTLGMEIVPNENYFSDEVFDTFVVEKLNAEKGSFLDLLAQATKNRRTLEYLRLKNASMIIPETRFMLPNYRDHQNTIYALGLGTHKIYFDEMRPNYINYGFMGSMLTHALSKVLEVSVGTNQTTISIGTCISEETLKGDESHLLGYLAVGQKLLYAAYQDWVKRSHKELPLANVQHTPNQLFWISSVLTYCKPNNFHGFYSNKLLNPKKFISKVIRNNQRFAKDFNCLPGSAMFPTSKCSVI